MEQVLKVLREKSHHSKKSPLTKPAWALLGVPTLVLGPEGAIEPGNIIILARTKKCEWNHKDNS